MPYVECKTCHKKFYIKPSYQKLGWGKYCSKKCKDEGQKKGRFVSCSYCGKKIYRNFSKLHRESKTKTYFCNKSCQCAWKNKQRKKKFGLLLKCLRRLWCKSSTTGRGPVREGANPSGLPSIITVIVLKFSKSRDRRAPIKRPAKRILYDLYWKKHYTQAEIGVVFNATSTSVRRWLDYYKIPLKPRTLSCGRNPATLKNLELGRTPEALKKSARARRRYTKENLVQKIEEFVKEHGRVPTKNDFANNPSYPDPFTYRDYFGTWSKAIKKAGFKPNESLFVSRHLYAKDGHLCNSISEMIIDNWLFENNIPHSREKLYPEGRYRCDFVVEGIFIEFFGLSNAPNNIAPHYSAVAEKKKKLCEKYKIPLIELYAKDLYNLDQVLGKILKKTGKILEI